ncbi:MAG TPA: class I SAM-dependent methyltransferase [Chitinophagaceae bacterium]
MNNLTIIHDSYLTASVHDSETFTEQYILLREKEGRLYTNEQIKNLPEINPGHPHYKEWLIRKKTSSRLLRHLSKNPAFNALEVGCGNGWLTNKLSAATTGYAMGLDINKVELLQAQKVFEHSPRLHFVNGDLLSGIPEDRKFDVIVFAASIQYFSSLKDILQTALQHLTLQGEIHIIDSRFYQPNEVSIARERTREYFNAIGFPGMSRYYFHHCIDQLESFQYKILYDPSSWLDRLSFYKTPFHWIVIKNRYR